MGARRTTGPHGQTVGRRSPRWRVAGALTVLLATVGGLILVYWYWRRTTVEGVAARGVEMLASADTPTRVVAALDEWERQTGKHWHGRRDDLIVQLFARRSLSDRRVRLLLTRVAGADYGERRDDWQQWFKTHKLIQKGEQPKVTGRRRVRLEPRWEAPIGLTAWFSTIIPLDGQVYVASLGAAFGDESDAADGIVRVDGASGRAELIFQPPDAGARDLLGIAAGDGCLFATCENGHVYCVDPDGKLRWSMRVGGGLAGPPLSLDVNRDGAEDVVLVRRGGEVVALHGQTGKTLWTSAAPKRPADERRGGAGSVGAMLAAGPVSADGRQDIVVTTVDGGVRVLAAQNGSLRWDTTLAAGTIGGVVVAAEPGRVGPPAYVADRAASIWTLIRSGKSMEAVTGWDLAVRSDDSLIAGLRTLGRAGRPPMIVACPTGAYTAHQAGVCVLEPGGVRWRYSPGGAIWATPALADINGDGETEFIVASIDVSGGGQAVGVVTALSATGQCLRRLTLSAPVECSPVVADVDGDNRLEVLIADQAGWLHCFATGRIGPVEWGLVGGDSHNTRNQEHAYSFGQAPVGVQWRWKPD